VTFTATVTANSPGSGVPTGNVTFMDGSTVMGTVKLDATGNAAFTTSTLSIGQHNIQALYAGSSQYSASNSPVLVQTVITAVSPAVLATSNGLTDNRTSSLPAAESTAVPAGELAQGWRSQLIGLNLQMAAAGDRAAAPTGHLPLTFGADEPAKASPFTPGLAELDRLFASLAEGLGER
jgi:hypothetical protein